MCEPVSIGLGAVALGSSIMKGIAEKDAAEERADAMRRNADVAEQAASLALQRGEESAGRIRMQGEGIRGAQRAGYAKGGVVVNTGSAARTQEDTAALTESDVQTERNNAQREAWGLKKQAENMRKDAESTEKAGKLALAGSIIGGAANAFAIGSGGFGGAKPPGVAGGGDIGISYGP